VLLRRVSTVVVCALLLLLAAGEYDRAAVYAGQSFQPVNPEELKMTSEPLAPGAPAIILYRQVDRDDNGDTSHEDHYIRIKVFTEEGRKNADVEIPFVKGGYNVAHLHARTIRPDGSIAEFDGKVFEKEIVKARGYKYLAKTFTLPDVQVGSIIEYFFTYDFAEDALYGSNWILSQELFTKAAKFSLKPYVSDSIFPVTVRWWPQLPAGVTPPREGKDHLVRMEANNIAAFKAEDYMPPENELKARVDFIYSFDKFDPDPTKYWKGVGQRLNTLVEAFVNKKKAMESAVSQIVSVSDAPEVKLRKIYDRVQLVRNTSYEVSKTEQEEKRTKEKEAGNVQDVWNRGYGDGDDLDWLFLGLVRAAGFEAYPVYVSDRRNYFFTAQAMNPNELDASVVLVKLNGVDEYFDPGAAFTPFGLLEWAETGVAGLRLDKEGGTWIKSTLPKSSDSRVERKARLTLSEAGDLEGKLTVNFTGLEAMSRRVEELHSDDVEKKKYLEDQIKEYIPVGAEVDLINHPDWKSSSLPLVAEFNLKIQGWVSGAGRHAVMPATVFGATEKHIFESANRVYPVYFQFPFEREDDVTIDLPAGWQVQSLPAPQDLDRPAVGYKLNVEKDATSLRLTRKVKVDILMLETKYYSTVRNFFQGVRTGDEQQIVLQPAATAAVN
jgi:hypothetical protein